MRLQLFLVLAALALLLPVALSAKTFNELTIDKIEGTVMVQPVDGSKPYAIQTGTTLQKGDTISCYDKSWVILKTHRGDKIGMDSGTVMNIDEYYLEGPDRQIRLVLQKGSLLLRTNGCGSRQSFFEINSGPVVTSINNNQSILSYDPASESLVVKYLTGKLSVIDKDDEQKFKVEHSENTWKAGKMAKAEPDPIDEVDEVNFNKFFNGEPRIAPPSNDFLLTGND
jgi:hypothetical protein